jgi:hypothetical protein
VGGQREAVLTHGLPCCCPGPSATIRLCPEQHEGVRPFGASRLSNGNTLIADAVGARVIEVDPGGKVVFEVKDMAMVHDADHLPNGNTLITLRSTNQVIEVDQTGKVVWQLDKLRHPSDALRLPSGNTLVAEQGQVREFDQAGQEVRSIKLTWPVHVKRY